MAILVALATDSTMTVLVVLGTVLVYPSPRRPGVNRASLKVTGIVGRADVLACIFFLLSFLVYHGQQTANVWSSVCLGTLSMLAKETGVTVLLLNLLYDLCRSWHSIRRSISEARWNEDSRHFSRRAAALLVSLGILLVVRLALLHGALPKFSPQDNPAAFHPCFHVRDQKFNGGFLQSSQASRSKMKTKFLFRDNKYFKRIKNT
ncbi:protein O-mannosyl-transferase TMTC1-like isoform X3 [Vespula squamosa]|uniref:Protein O-mannosyl-transferase TMTC1-like isoform X3 n=1 Tax=Vespula squamosa TaxID=30214 RepID=A0ABD1ZX11_VESSQ